MKKKLIGIVIIALVGTFLIYKFTKKQAIYLLALGDSFATGMTTFQIEGYNYNDYLHDHLEKNYKLKEYNHHFTTNDDTSFKLLMKIINNHYDKNHDETLKQVLNKANIITIGIGMDELGLLSLKNGVSKEQLLDYIGNMDAILKEIREINTKQIILLGAYQSYELTQENIIFINDELRRLSSKYNVDFVSVEEIVDYPEYFGTEEKTHLNYKGHQYIFSKVSSIIKVS